MPWITFEDGNYGPYTRAFIGVVKMVPAGEMRAFDKDRYGNFGASPLTSVALYEVNPPSISAAIFERFPKERVERWALQQDALAAVILAHHIDGREFWGAVVNLNTGEGFYPLLKSDKQIASEFTGGLFGFGKKPKKKPVDLIWREDLRTFGPDALDCVLTNCTRLLQQSSASGRL